MVFPQGFWDANNPSANPVTDDITFEQHNMNRTLMQKGDTPHITGVLTKHGVFGYNEDNGILYRVNSVGVLESLNFIKTGLDADKPAENESNNGSWFYATDTSKLYTVINAMKIEFTLLSSLAFEISDDAPVQSDYVENKIWIEY